jgi:hypothetical protein
MYVVKHEFFLDESVNGEGRGGAGGGVEMNTTDTMRLRSRMETSLVAAYHTYNT